MKYVVFGSGGFAKEVIDYIEQDKHTVVAVVSPTPFNQNSYNQKHKVINEIKQGEFPDAQFILAVGETHIKKKIVQNTEDRWGNFIHSSCVVSSYAKLGKGIIMCPYSCVLGDSEVQDFVTIGVHCTVSHDNYVGNYVTFSPYSGTMGNCYIQDECFFGASSYCIPKVTLGKNIKVSAGSVVRHSYSDECVLLGNPAKPRI